MRVGYFGNGLYNYSDSEPKREHKHEDHSFENTSEIDEADEGNDGRQIRDFKHRAKSEKHANHHEDN